MGMPALFNLIGDIVDAHEVTGKFFFGNERADTAGAFEKTFIAQLAHGPVNGHAGNSQSVDELIF